MGNFRGQEWLILALIVLLLFGARRLPDLARSIGKSMKIFRNEVKDMGATDGAGTGSTPPVSPTSGSASAVPPVTGPAATTDDTGERRP